MGHIPREDGVLACPKCKSKNTAPIFGDDILKWNCRSCKSYFTTQEWMAALHRAGKAMWA